MQELAPTFPRVGPVLQYFRDRLGPLLSGSNLKEESEILFEEIPIAIHKLSLRLDRVKNVGQTRLLAE
jgi:hypothetical protein